MARISPLAAQEVKIWATSSAGPAVSSSPNPSVAAETGDSQLQTRSMDRAAQRQDTGPTRRSGDDLHGGSSARHLGSIRTREQVLVQSQLTDAPRGHPAVAFPRARPLPSLPFPAPAEVIQNDVTVIQSDAVRRKDIRRAAARTSSGRVCGLKQLLRMAAAA